MTEPRFDLHPKASPEVVEERQALAERVCRELRRAGLPVYRGDLSGGPHSQPGVDVHVEPFVDGGVYVDWDTDAELRDAAVDLFAQGIDYSDPPAVVRHHNTVHKHMQAALLGILTSAGFEVEVPDPHGHGSAVQAKGFRP
ncbi:hypothetical protein [Streptomyces fulvoviolaceus]|uniref:hypothetical protein n=1 Tax=Streptomyces fulvoviolaceus TaxID=285535 RepID=UPI0021C18F80|nr:hypothetical protein [Streptomyces fulvoviolaceus]MCT9083798.1 hypothetical protein [Streptomyces fulvoviolaceus]